MIRSACDRFERIGLTCLCWQGLEWTGKVKSGLEPVVFG
jgi:hypothetical protein